MLATDDTQRWRAFSLLAVAYFMTTVDLTIVNVSLPTIGRDLHFTQTSLQWVVTAYALTYGGFLLLGGRVADLFGRRRVLMSALGVFSAASLGCALAPSEALLIGCRAIQGLGAAVMIPTAMSIVTDVFQEGPERNKALGIWGALGATGGTVGLLTGGLITRYLGWQYIFYLNVPIGTLALTLAPRLLPRGASRARKRRFDLPGALVGTGGLVVLADAIAQSPQYGWGATRTITAFSFIPISIAVLAGVRQQQAGLASGLMNTSIQLGAALGIAIASTVAASHTQALLHTGAAAPAALAAGYRQALWVLAAIALLALPVIFTLVGRGELTDPVAKAKGREGQHALAAAD